MNKFLLMIMVLLIVCESSDVTVEQNGENIIEKNNISTEVVIKDSNEETVSNEKMEISNFGNKEIEGENYKEDALLNANNNEPDTNLFAERLIWGGVMDSRNYNLLVNNIDKGSVYLHNEVIYEDEHFIVVHTYQIDNEYTKDNPKLIKEFPEGRNPDWYFVEFFDGSSIYYSYGGLVYIMTEHGFNEFMRTGEVQENRDMHIVACDYPLEDSLEKDEKGWHHYIEINSEGGFYNYVDVNKDTNVEIIYHGYSNLNNTNYYEKFIWKRGLGLIGYTSGFGAEKDVIEMTYIE